MHRCIKIQRRRRDASSVSDGKNVTKVGVLEGSWFEMKHMELIGRAFFDFFMPQL